MNLDFDIEAFTAKHITNRNESLLTNDLIQHSVTLKKEIEGKSLFVIGGAGTIGSSFIKALLAWLPARVVVVDINENGLSELVRDCRSNADIKMPKDFRTYPISFSDSVFEKLFKNEPVFDIIANFAAHKHVRSEKDMYSIEAMLRNNVIEAKNLLDLILQKPPRHFFCVSTDKAANPVSVMGASKKLMEEVILSYRADMKITTARFANVAFSNGSLLAGFIERLFKKQPLSSPSDIKRYFLSPIESGQLCLLACIVAQSGEVVFPILNPEKDLKSFSDIAVELLYSLGLKPAIHSSEEDAKKAAVNINFEREKSYPVYFFNSDTSGEKKFEEFSTDEEEEMDIYRFSNLGIVKNAKAMEKNEAERFIEKLTELFNRKATKEELIHILQEVVPNFHHIEKAKNLDQKM